MNKKVLTLCAGFLLAGSAFSPIYAHIGEGDDGMKEGQYYRINLRTADSNQANSNAYFFFLGSSVSSSAHIRAGARQRDRFREHHKLCKE